MPVTLANADAASQVSPARSELEERKLTLVRRLEDGYSRIELALQQGRDVTQWEDLWETLLHEYEAICDELGRMPNE
ncbi:hypothetical protein [Nitrolancea hollandica]|uniref:Uncharacterized protein n=1 Tax=Nitrolancea hollandica Lb TaxID=1129897 RepID=I4ECE6_9BACT|nr:hypothetical protein [Nitrolancea hollandica]CCF82358.1 hypothetical protein NITHO_1030012 [Nitrolancea hollandica Lb]